MIVHLNQHPDGRISLHAPGMSVHCNAYGVCVRIELEVFDP